MIWATTGETLEKLLARNPADASGGPPSWEYYIRESLAHGGSSLPLIPSGSGARKTPELSVTALGL
ncbi:MAG: hypothetical protein M3O22_04540 [Pseudomonadota bacterium]|nr:hypothetical protein [Pseudomonadota bacterium]